MSHETFSALMDGECSASEIDAILAEFEASEEARETWSRMCQVRDVLGGCRIDDAGDQLVANVMAAVLAERAEPVALAPVLAAPSPKVVPLPVRTAARRSWQQPLIGLAAAASIAGAVVIGGNSLLSQPAGGRALAAADPGRASGLVPVSARTEVAGAEPAETRWAQLDSDSARQLNDYMMEHSNYRAEQGMGGSLSYARMTVRTADYRPASEQH